MHHDDEQVGRVLTRREVLAMLGVAGGAALAGGRLELPLPERAFADALPPCVVRPEQTAGPYFVEEDLNRSDICTDPTDGSRCEGVPLDLTFRVSRIDADACRPLEGATVQVWQCDALGVYSDVEDIAGRFDTRGRKFLRGHQVTGAEGTVRFATVYPGWYEGRTVHVHFTIRAASGSGGSHEFTSQLYFDDAVTDQVMRREPYASKEGPRVRNGDDRIFRQGGDELILALARTDRGYAGTFDIGLRLE